MSFDFYMIEAKPEHLIGDKAYDSDDMDDQLKREGVELIAPQRSNRKLKTQDGRALRRYSRRWLVERAGVCGTTNARSTGSPFVGATARTTSELSRELAQALQ